MRRILIEVSNLIIEAELNTSYTSDEIWKVLPIESTYHRWGDEIYFPIPVKSDLEPEAREDVNIGDLGYWPSGSAFCIFFGPTPVSKGDLPKAYSPVNILGRITGDATLFRATKDGEKIIIRRYEEEF